MKESTLQQAKKQIHTFREAMQPVIKYWGSNKYTLINTLLQNLSFNSVGTVEYNHNKEVQKCRTLLNAIENIAKYESNCHVTGYINDEIHSIWDGLNMSEDYEN